ncbi:Metal-dependent hydrolase, endonuclease/exonuclease/phosphatase family [Leeuwenhoekiella marinoflava DSM 3653]|uniref:Endonuclease/exonuclease/phosphatase family metal-dependent hydrolase n=3 Tax=Leeuwenhoekiella marinoflava TaxID=988 RepID=A0A4Q0PLI1_9FLAO|nr:endonuclease/exonuclease/phosphatase family metal-dependent hydrolase [Leeuwenhoekiella marinoflava]SHF52283.1 Metal-dependent hydrolase, endonuclease/exonuclease/phosphatase family [Leeuwenhoekiella marinoflava DSM 3653]
MVLALLLISSANSQENKKELNICSFNVRYNSPDDGINIWENRKDWLTHSMRFYQADLMGTQEVTHTQLVDMQALLPNYAYIGIGREGDTQGEYSAIFYKKDRFEVVDSNTFWLSETPNVIASKGWDAALPRIVTWALFKDKHSGVSFYHFNTHFDHRGKQARIESAALLTQKINEIAGGSPVLLTGDFNSSPDSEAIDTLLKNGLKDPYLNLDSDQVYGPEYSANGWDAAGRTSDSRIDYVFYKGAVQPLTLQILDGQRGQRYISDHFPVIAKVELSNN